MRELTEEERKRKALFKLINKTVRAGGYIKHGFLYGPKGNRIYTYNTPDEPIVVD